MDTFTFAVDTPTILTVINRKYLLPSYPLPSTVFITDNYDETIEILYEIIKNSENSLLCAKYKNATHELKIIVIYDQITHQIQIEDTGIGMSRTDLINYLGIIGKSGTKHFRENVSDLSFHGTCDGIGFYSLFLIADQIQVYSIYEGVIHRWEWSSVSNETLSSSFTIEVMDGTNPIVKDLYHGTRVMITLKEERWSIFQDNHLPDKLQSKLQQVRLCYPIEITSRLSISVRIIFNTFSCCTRISPQIRKLIQFPAIRMPISRT